MSMSAFLGTLAISFGPVIAKEILKTWLGEGMLAKLGDSAVDLLFRLHAREPLSNEQRFTQLGAQVAAQLRTVFEREGARLSYEARAAVALEVADTLASANLSVESLIACRLDPARVTRMLADARPNATRLFLADEAALYTRMLAETSAAIVQIAEELAGFSGLTEATSLHIQDRILETVTQLFTHGEREAGEFEARYRAEIARRLNHLDFFGIPRVEALMQRQSLSTAYITLQAAQYTRQQHPSTELLHTFLGTNDTHSAPGDQTAPLAMEVERVLALSRRVVIRGEAGSGKTTLLHWLAVRSAERSFPAPLTSWNTTIPLFAHLRQRAHTGLPAPEAFPILVAPLSAGSMPDGWAHRALESGRALVLIDGIDELPRDQRPLLLHQLAMMMQLYPLARYVITSRPAAIKLEQIPEWDEWIKQHHVSEINLQPMQALQIHQFIDHWHQALPPQDAAQGIHADIALLPDKLKRQLTRRPALRKLATNPLLCAMICALHYERGEYLPAERLKLYEECVEMLLNRRDSARTVPANPQTLHHAQQLACMQSLALWFLRNDLAEEDAQRVDEHLEHRIALMNVSAGTDGASIRSSFVERTGLLHEPSDGRIAFAHRTFQEYLAAQAILREGGINDLIAHADHDQWREVIILAAGLARPHESARIVNGLLSRANRVKTRQRQMRVLAIACLETCVELSPELRAHVIAQAASLFPPQNSEDAKLIAAAGDPAVPLLSAQESMNAAEAAACVQALALIGSDAALTSIAAYAEDTRLQVGWALGWAWDRFDRREYARRVLQRSPRLVLPIFSSWQGFEFLKHLPELIIEDGTQLRDISELAQLSHLRTLILGPADGPLDSLSRLLFGSSIQVSDLSPLAALTELQSLGLPHCKYVRELAPLHALRSLRELDVRGTSVQDLSPLAALAELEQLNLAWCDNVSDISPLAGLPRLSTLNLSSTRVSDLAPLAHLPRLSTLFLKGCSAIHSLVPLANLPNLKTLYISETLIGDAGILDRFPGAVILSDSPEAEALPI